MIEKILLIGPSSDITNFNKEYLLKHKEENYKLFCYADVLNFFVTHGVQPDYFSFVDPNTLDNQYDSIKSGFCKNTTIITPNIYHNKLSKFFKIGYTCNHLQKVGNFKRVLKLLSEICETPNLHFKQYDDKEFNLSKVDINILKSLNFKETYTLFQGDRSTNRCKLSYVIFPLILHHFSDIKEIKLIGFGHYNSPRSYLNTVKNNTKGYSEYKTTYQIIKPFLQDFFRKNNIKVHFDGAKSYYDELKNK